jgi:transcriptional regulator with XRE-family HTH domain
MTKLSLAQLISTQREMRGLSQIGLAKKSSLSIALIENIESGQELFLSAPVRQKLARALKLEPNLIKSLEKRELDFDNTVEYVENIKERILTGELEGLKCPICKSELICRIAELYDLEDRLIKHPKARCSKCPFQIK